jgi:hypothetical protein
VQWLAYDRAWGAIAEWVNEPSPERLERARALAAVARLAIVRLPPAEGQRTAFAVHELEGARVPLGWSTVLVFPGSDGPILDVPQPVREQPIAPASVEVCASLGCKAIVVAGTDESSARWGFGWTARTLVVQHLRPASTVELRMDPTVAAGEPILHVGEGLPEDVDPNALPIGAAQLDWSWPALSERGRSVQGLVLRIAPNDAERLVVPRRVAIRSHARVGQWMRGLEADVDAYATSTYLAPSPHELQVLERSVVTPFLDNLTALDRAPMVAVYADLLGFDLVRFEPCARAGEVCWGLSDAERFGRDGWGTVIASASQSKPLAIEVPRPWQAVGTARLGTELWTLLQARILVLAGADGRAEQPAAADPMGLGNVRTGFLAIHQAIDRHLSAQANGEPPLALLVGGFAAQREIDADLVVGLGRPILASRQVPARLARILVDPSTLGQFSQRLSDGSVELYPLSGSGIPALEYSLELGNVDAAVLWFSPTVRAPFAAEGVTALERRFERLGHALAAVDEIAALREPALMEATAASIGEHDRIVELAERFATTHNIRHAHRLFDRAARFGATVQPATGELTGLPLVRIVTCELDVCARSIVFLNAENVGREHLFAGETSGADEVRKAVFARRRTVTLVGRERGGR